MFFVFVDGSAHAAAIHKSKRPARSRAHFHSSFQFPRPSISNLQGHFGATRVYIHPVMHKLISKKAPSYQLHLFL